MGGQCRHVFDTVVHCRCLADLACDMGSIYSNYVSKKL